MSSIEPIQLQGDISNSLDSSSVSKQILQGFYYRIGPMKEFLSRLNGD
jgi:predicted transcriptional regulator with HTH domain